MQGSGSGTASPAGLKWYKTRTVISGLWLAGLAGLYFVLVYPVAIAEVPPSDYRFTFFIIALIYAIDLGILALEWAYKVVRKPTARPAQEKVGRQGVLAMILKIGLVVSVGGSYVTGAAVATPTVFSSLQFLAGGGTVVIFADFLHSVFATLIIAFGVALLVFEVGRIAMKKSTWRNWLLKARYPETKLFYWFFGIAVIAQGILGLFLLGTISPIGPFSILGENTYAFETLVRHLHGPLGAVVFALFTNLIYLRLRPEFHIR